MQVLHLAFDELDFMPSFCSVRHLLAEQADLQPVIDSLPSLPLLETLSLMFVKDITNSPRYLTAPWRVHHLDVQFSLAHQFTPKQHSSPCKPKSYTSG